MYSVILVINKDAFYVKRCVLLAPFLLYRGLRFFKTLLFLKGIKFLFGCYKCRPKFFIWILQMQASVLTHNFNASENEESCNNYVQHY
jgi:hypothetical protein